MSKELDYIADLERENRTIKSFLYCTKRSCNNCGKVNCENFQRQRIDCCGHWVSYKDYINELEKGNAGLKEKLEKETNHRIQNFNKSIEWKEKHRELKKENVELKADNDARKFAMTMSEKVEKQLREQLAKAKEIIKDLMSFSVQLCDCRHTVDFEKTREQAEQFIKEIEK